MRGTYDVVPLSGLRQEERGLPVLGHVTLEHVEGLAEGEITHDVEPQVGAPLGNVLGGRPGALGAAAGQLVDVGPHVREHVVLDALQGGVGEGVAHDAALAGVGGAVEGRVRREDAGRRVEGQVEAGFADVGAVAVDGFQGGRVIDGKGVGAIADECSWELV